MSGSVRSDGSQPQPGDDAPAGQQMRGTLALDATPGATPAGLQDGTLSGSTLMPLRLTVNGTLHRLDIDPRESLLDVLRERLDLTGTKKGCNQGACGACTVLVDGRRINACLALAAMYNDAQVSTIEGLSSADGDLHPLQAAFIAHDGFQCGFCTAGQIMSGVACINEGHATSADDVRFWMSGNICRCGAYPGVVAAIAEVGGRKLP
ncbi:(2Fe-2S)-binding protein [Cupriavidus necator]